MTTNAKILLAEDDAIAARHLGQALVRMGYQVCAVVQSGEEVITNVMENEPDIILMDITLDGSIDGICTMEKVHARTNVPVIYITANSDLAVFEKAKQTKPYAYITKPYETYQLQNAIEIALFKHALEKKLDESEKRYRTLFEVGDSAMMLVDEHSTIIMVNEQFEYLTGCSKESVEQQKSWTDFFDKDAQALLRERLRQAVDDISVTRSHFDLHLVGREGRNIVAYTNVKKIPGTSTCIVSMNDISELKSAEAKIQLLNHELKEINKDLHQEISLRERVEKQLRFKATHDHLTGLPNRVLLFDRLKQAFAFEERHNALIAVMILDLDNFKLINDSMGHFSGDILLKRVASGLQKCMRQYDTVGRLGGDEFVIIFNDANAIQDIVTFTEKILGIFQEPFEILGQQIYVTTSIGVSVYPLHGSTIEELLKKADMAMYVAKKSGRNTFRFFSNSMDVQDTTQKNMREERRQSLLEGSQQEFFLTPGDLRSADGKKTLPH